MCSGRLICGRRRRLTVEARSVGAPGAESGCRWAMVLARRVRLFGRRGVGSGCSGPVAGARGCGCAVSPSAGSSELSLPLCGSGSGPEGSAPGARGFPFSGRRVDGSPVLGPSLRGLVLGCEGRGPAALDRLRAVFPVDGSPACGTRARFVRKRALRRTSCVAVVGIGSESESRSSESRSARGGVSA